MSSKLDAPQVLQNVHDKDNEALKVISVGGTLTPEAFDEADYTYVPDGQNGAGQVATATYKMSGTTVSVLTFSYNASNQLTSVVKS